MAAFLAIMLFVVALSAALCGVTQKAVLDLPNAPFPARQIAYNMRLYHQAAITYKLANPALTGTLAVPVQNWLTEWRVIACASATSLSSYSTGVNAAQNRDIVSELLRQSVSPPELGLVSASPFVTGYGGAVTAQIGYAPGIGLSNGATVTTNFGAVTPACAIPAGAAVITIQGL